VSKAQSYQSYQLTVAWSLNCLHVIVSVALRGPGELTKDLTLKAKDKDNNTGMKLNDGAVVLPPRL